MRTKVRIILLAGLLAVSSFAQEGVSETTLPAVPTKVTDIWVVFKTHFDIGYTDLVTNVLKRYRVEMMDNALAVMEKNRDLAATERFTWTVPGWPLAHILGPLQTPERRARIKQAIRDGELAVHALPFTMHTESLDLEDLVRGLYYSAQIDRDYGLLLVRSAKETDVPEHSWVQPTLLANAGIRFLQIGCNAACQYPRFPHLFYWEGPDGSRVLCNYTIKYGSDIVSPKDWPCKNYLAMIMAGDNHGPPTAAEVDSIRQAAAKNLPGVKIHFGTLDDFRVAVEAEKPELPVVRGDTPDTWIHGLMSMPQAMKLARNIRPLEPALDALDTHLKIYGLATPPLAHLLATAYENSLLFGEHTWGMNGEFGGRRIWPLAEWKKKLPLDRQEIFLKSFDDHRDYIRTTDEIVTRELQARLNQLAHSVNVAGPRIVVWNALPWTRSGLVQVGDKELYVEDVPANGYKTFSAGAAVEPVKSDSLDTPFYRVSFDLQRGGIASLVEKKSGRELVDNASVYVLGQFLHERFGKNEVIAFFKAYSRMAGGWALNDLGKPGMSEEPYLASSPSGWKLSTQQSAHTDVAILTAGDTKGLAKAYTLKFIFSHHDNSVEVEWIVADKTPDKMPEGGWLCFPFAVEKPRFTLGRLGGPVNPATEIVPGASRHLCAVATGVSIAGANGTGVGLCPLDSPLVGLDHPGLWEFDLDFIPKTPSVFVNLYNNKWNTNFPLWQDGSWSERVRFWPTDNLVVPGWEARVPLLAAVADGPSGKLPKTQTGLGVSRPGVLVTAFGADPYSDKMLLRLWEQAGQRGACEVKLPADCKATRAVPVNLRGEPQGEPLAIIHDTLTFEILPWAPASFRLE